MRKMLTLVAVLVATTSTLSADWSPELAAQYLDGRQQEWFAWKPAMSADGPCVSCHTGMTYLLARPALRRVLKESQPTKYEVGLLDRLRAKVGEKPAGALQGVETIFSAMFLSREDAMKAPTSIPGRTPSPAATARRWRRSRSRRRQPTIATRRRSGSTRRR